MTGIATFQAQYIRILAIIPLVSENVSAGKVYTHLFYVSHAGGSLLPTSTHPVLSFIQHVDLFVGFVGIICGFYLFVCHISGS